MAKDIDIRDKDNLQMEIVNTRVQNPIYGVKYWNKIQEVYKN